MTVHVVGVRHHSPACARAVRHVLDAVKPRWVLIEGPSDMNARMAELCLGHTLPIALFHYLSQPDRSTYCFTPFGETSPEWVALRWASEHGAEARFIDLPAWSEGFHHSVNRTADRIDRFERALNRLCERLGVDGSDALWDHLFEQPEPDPTRLLARLEVYFAALRPDANASEHDLQREAFMAACVAWADAQAGDVVVVCGGFHKPAIEARWPTVEPVWPQDPPVPEGARTGTYVVPWSNLRMDSFHGYAAGMPSPGWYLCQWRHGHREATERMMRAVTEALRRLDSPLSASDLIAVHVQLAGLMSLRGHTCATRVDVLDALCSALIKDALDAPPPWSRRGLIAGNTDPRLVTILDAMRGDARGRVHPDTPRPPIAHDVQAQLVQERLVPTAAPGRTVSLDRMKPSHRVRSQLLHRLRVLQIPGFERTRGPDGPTSADHRETWRLVALDSTLPALLEKSIWGGTLEDAARRYLVDQARLSHDLSALIRTLVDALFVGLWTLSGPLLDAAKTAARRERSLAVLGEGLQLVVDLWRHESAFVDAHHETLGGLVVLLLQCTVDRVDLDAAPDANAGRQRAMASVRVALTHGPVPEPLRALVRSVITRRSTDTSAPADLRGACLGLRACLGEDTDDALERAVRGVRPNELGDWLAGLFAVTRETLHQDAQLLRAIHARMSAMSPADFTEALPGLRLAFAWFPPREREQLGAAVLAILGLDPAKHRSLSHPSIDTAVLSQGIALAAETERLLAVYGLLP